MFLLSLKFDKYVLTNQKKILISEIIFFNYKKTVSNLENCVDNGD